MQKHVTRPLLNWYDTHGRKTLPWKNPCCAYRIWLSEIMLQQTQVKTVIPYFNRFIEAFPNIQDLANASDDAVMALWSGLGYYSRARHLHETAKRIHKEHNNQFPSDTNTLESFPGIGPSTAAAIASQAFNQPTPILDANVKRVLCRYFLVDGFMEQATVKKKLWHYAAQCMSQQRCADYTQAIMDLGATCCTNKNPQCTHCPLSTTCRANKQKRVDCYPNKKPKKSLPTKHQQFLVIYDSQKRIYLEKRPPKGIWGGLWCMPSIDMTYCAQTHILETLDMEVLEINKWITLKHTFSHFKLTIQTMIIKTKQNNSFTSKSGRWYAPDEIAAIGIATPVQTIINCFKNSPDYGGI